MRGGIATRRRHRPGRCWPRSSRGRDMASGGDQLGRGRSRVVTRLGCGAGGSRGRWRRRRRDVLGRRPASDGIDGHGPFVVGQPMGRRASPGASLVQIARSTSARPIHGGSTTPVAGRLQAGVVLTLPGRLPASFRQLSPTDCRLLRYRDDVVAVPVAGCWPTHRGVVMVGVRPSCRSSRVGHRRHNSLEGSDPPDGASLTEAALAAHAPASSVSTPLDTVRARPDRSRPAMRRALGNFAHGAS